MHKNLEKVLLKSNSINRRGCSMSWWTSYRIFFNGWQAIWQIRNSTLQHIFSMFFLWKFILILLDIALLTLNEWLLWPRKFEWVFLGIAPKQPLVLQLWLWLSNLFSTEEWEDIVDAREVADPLENPEAHEDVPELIEYNDADCGTFSPMVYDAAPTL